MKKAFLILLTILSACSKGEESAASQTGGVNEVELPEAEETSLPPNSKSKRIGTRGYTVKVLSALDFLARKGEKVASEDKAGLQEEAVVLLEIAAPDGQKDFFDSPELTLTKEDAMQYLVGNIAQDFSIQQGKDESYPNGVHFERMPGAPNKLRVILYFSGIQADEKMKISYDDHLLGAGIIHFVIN